MTNSDPTGKLEHRSNISIKINREIFEILNCKFRKWIIIIHFKMDKTSENKQKYKGSGYIMRILKSFRLSFRVN